LIETVVAGEPISKEKLTSEEIKRYISRKTEAIQNQFKKENVTLIEDKPTCNAILLKSEQEGTRNRLFRKPMNCG
jgi:hypothetical protein